MRSVMKKAAVREIKGSFGRYFAILAIIALGVGFFCGVRITTPAMVNTVNSFLDENEFYDYRLVSSVGWSDEDAEIFSAENDVRAVEGSYSLDAVCSYDGGSEEVMKVHSVTSKVNSLKLVSGRMPQSPDECVIDADLKKIPELGTMLTILPKTAIRLRLHSRAIHSRSWERSILRFISTLKGERPRSETVLLRDLFTSLPRHLI